MCELQSVFKVHAVFKSSLGFYFLPGFPRTSVLALSLPVRRDMPGVHLVSQWLSPFQDLSVKCLAGPPVCCLPQVRSQLKCGRDTGFCGEFPTEVALFADNAVPQGLFPLLQIKAGLSSSEAAGFHSQAHPGSTAVPCEPPAQTVTVLTCGAAVFHE